MSCLQKASRATRAQDSFWSWFPMTYWKSCKCAPFLCLWGAWFQTINPVIMSRTIYFEANVLSGGLRSPGVAVPFAGVDSIRTGGAALRSGERHDEIPHRFVLFLLQPGAGCRNEFFIYLMSCVTELFRSCIRLFIRQRGRLFGILIIFVSWLRSSINRIRCCKRFVPAVRIVLSFAPGLSPGVIFM